MWLAITRTLIEMWALTWAAGALLGLLTVSTAFNLDGRHPVIFQGPVTEPGVARGASYFGYAVGLTKADDGAWVLVGAPRATSTLGIHDVPKTGALFKCGTLSQPGCREVVLDTAAAARRQGQPPFLYQDNDTRRQGQPPFLYQDRKDGAWIGGALDTDPSPQGKISTI
ncbi:Integrin alpha-9 [Amphibalanus amphitrite]|uniref:Integrin alpha-9 n=1 Tax=Amphibalanus amphitrite TaxID=1232801 RepID=A0A6A4WNL1_AMPAM|nr:Integrin alpha-9 [Amphibalanus amphitrite]